MQKAFHLVFGLALAAGGWFFFQNYEIQGLENVRVVSRGDAADLRTTSASPLDPAIPAATTRSSIRVATFNIQVFGITKASKPKVMDVLARIIRQFDVVAVQEIRCQRQDLLPEFVERINQTGRHYDYVIGPRLGNSSSKEQYAFIFDRETLEIDRHQLYTVDDPDNLLHREPLVGWFRVRGPSPDESFTFTLVNVHTDPDVAEDEVNILDNVYHLVRDDGREEDDVIILGDFNVDDDHLGQLGEVSGMTWVISGTPTNVRSTAQYDNIVFHAQSTTEFTGRGTVFDFLRQYNLSLDEALEVSDHLPVWAEFSVLEGGQRGRVATRPTLVR